MREILFRGKRADCGEWVEGFYLQKPNPYSEDGQPVRHCIIDLPPFGYDIDPSTVGQFTGMTDKNGKKIFEGDIVMKRTYHGKTPCRVVFSYGCFHCGFGGGSSTATHPYLLDDKQIEVVGNIYDNPELIKHESL